METRKQSKSNNADPRKIVRTILRKKNIAEIRKRLEEREVVKCQIQEIYAKNRDNHSKQILRRIVCGNIVKQNRMCKRLQDSYVPLRSEKNLQSENFTIINRKTYQSIQLKLQHIVRNFFEENSRMCPGKNDCITRKNIKKQKNDSVKMLYLKFKNFYPAYSISYTLFSTMRPFWTVPANANKRDTCLCTKHENMKLLIQTLHRAHVINHNNTTSLVASITCQPSSKDCLNRSCVKCQDKHLQINEISMDKMLNAEEWVTIKENRESFKTKKQICVQRTIKQCKQKTVKDLIEKLKDSLQPFMDHVLRIEHQYRAMKELKNSLTEHDLLLHIDFNENYTCKYAQEPQSVHFGASRESVTLHTGIAYMKNDLQSFCTMSHSLRHDPSAIIAHLIPILQKSLQKNPNITHIHFLSDGPTSQYRNKITFALLTSYLINIPGFETIQNITYNFSESGHGKGAADGIGGTIKRTADRLVAQGNDLNDFEAVYKYLKNNLDNVYLSSVSENEISLVDEQIPKDLKTFCGTMKVHQWTWKRANPNVILFNELSCYECSTEKCRHFHLGMWKILPEIKATN